MVTMIPVINCCFSPSPTMGKRDVVKECLEFIHHESSLSAMGGAEEEDGVVEERLLLREWEAVQSLFHLNACAVVS